MRSFMLGVIIGLFALNGYLIFQHKSTTTAVKAYHDTTITVDDDRNYTVHCDSCSWKDKVIQEEFQEGLSIKETKDWVTVFGTIVNDDAPNFYYIHKHSGDGEVATFSDNTYKSTWWDVRETPVGMVMAYTSKYEFGEDVILPKGKLVRVWADNPDYTRYSEVEFIGFVRGLLDGRKVGGGLSLIIRKDGSTYNPNVQSIVE